VRIWARRVRKFAVAVTLVTLISGIVTFGHTPVMAAPIDLHGDIPPLITPEAALGRLLPSSTGSLDLPDPRRALDAALAAAMSFTGTAGLSAPVVGGSAVGGSAPQSSQSPLTSSVPTPPWLDLPTPPPPPPPELPVDRHAGALVLEAVDLALPGNGLSFELTRDYSSLSTEAGPFGRGWQSSLEGHLRMYVGYHITEFRPDGGRVTYEFVEDDPNGFVEEYDGDEYINYNLDLGHYDPAARGETLERLGPEEYVVTHLDGTRYVYNGYLAPWRQGLPADAGRLLRIEDRHGNTEACAYDAEGRLTGVTDSAGRQITLTWEDGLVTAVSGPAGVIQYAYDAEGHLVAVTGPDGAVTGYAYDSAHRPTRVTGPASGQWQYAYDSEGRVAFVTDPTGIVTAALTYTPGSDGAGETTVTDAAGAARVYAYDDKGRLVQETDPLGRQTTYAYDADGNLTSVTGPTGEWQYEYDGLGRVVRTTDGAGVVTETEYDPVWGFVSRTTGPLGDVTTCIYDSQGNLTNRTDALGQTTAFAYDTHGRLVAVTDPGGGTTTFDYDHEGNLIRTTDPLGNVDEYGYDGAGRLEWSRQAGEDRVYLHYDAGGRLSRTSAWDEGTLLDLDYDVAGRLAESGDGLGNRSRYEYDAAGRPVRFVVCRCPGTHL